MMPTDRDEATRRTHLGCCNRQRDVSGHYRYAPGVESEHHDVRREDLTATVVSESYTTARERSAPLRHEGNGCARPTLLLARQKVSCLHRFETESTSMIDAQPAQELSRAQSYEMA